MWPEHLHVSHSLSCCCCRDSGCVIRRKRDDAFALEQSIAVQATLRLRLAKCGQGLRKGDRFALDLSVVATDEGLASASFGDEARSEQRQCMGDGMQMQMLHLGSRHGESEHVCFTARLPSLLSTRLMLCSASFSPSLCRQPLSEPLAPRHVRMQARTIAAAAVAGRD